MSNAFLALGSNLGDRAENLADAVRRLNDPPRVMTLRISPVFETAPVGISDQPDFLNMVVMVSTSLKPHELLNRCLEIEQSLGRVRRQRWGPRTIDLDLLIYDDAVINDDTLTIPHPEMSGRSFVVVPLAEIAPDTKIGDTTARELANRLGREGLKELGPLKW